MFLPIISKNLVFLLIISNLFISMKVFAGNCDYPDDRAKDGSRCGDRAASVRPGGRNPDTDWLVWAGLIGVAAFFYFNSKNSGSSNKNSKTNYESIPRKPNFTNKNKFENKVEYKKEQDINYNIHVASNSAKARAEKVIRRDFGYALDMMYIKNFEQAVSIAEVSGGNEYDAAVKYMLIQLNIMYPGDKSSKDFVNSHSYNMKRVLSKCLMGTSNYLAELNKLRSKHGLEKI